MPRKVRDIVIKRGFKGQDKETIEDAVIVGDLAYFKDYGLWSLTHLNTGWAIAKFNRYIV